MKPNHDTFIVITKTKFHPDVKDELFTLVKESQPIFKSQPGCISFVSHLSTDETYTMSYMEWASKEDHINCMNSADFDGTNPRWQALFDSGKASLEFETFRKL